MNRKKKLKCFISAPTNFDLSNLFHILKSHNIDYFNPITTPFDYGMNFQNQIREQIDKADFIITIFIKDDLNIIYEIGLAQGMNKKIFTIIPNKIEPPSFIKDTLYLRTDLNNINSINFAFEPFLNSLKSKYKKKKYGKIKSKKMHINFNKVINEVEDIRKKGNEIVLLTILEKVFKDIDADIIKVKNKDEFKVDMSLWIKDFENILGNPAVVEIKYGNISEKKISDAELQLAIIINKTNARLGFILYLDKKGRKFSSYSNKFPNIFRFEISDLIQQLSNKSFLDIILTNRNIKVHSLED